MIDTATPNAAAVDQMGAVLQALGAKTVGSAEKGRAAASWRGSKDSNLSYGKGFVTDHTSGETFDALGIVAHVRGLDLRRAADLREAAEILAGILGIRLDEEAPRRSADRAPRPVPPIARPERPARDVAALWCRLARRAPAGEAYLEKRGLILGEPLSDLVRFNVGSGDVWLDARAREGYGLAFPARRPDGTIQTLSLRYTGPGEAPKALGKAPALAGSSTRAAGVCRPEIALLAKHDPEFDRDEVVILEGPTDTLAATLAFDLDSLEQRTPPVWALGALGVASVPAMLEAFAPILADRTVHVALDVDPPGEAAVPAAVEAAWKAGARRVTRMRAPRGKDLAEAWSSHA